MTATSIFILYPEKGFVPAAKIAVWYNDAVANREIADEYLNAHDTITMARALSDAGLITVAQWRDNSDVSPDDLALLHGTDPRDEHEADQEYCDRAAGRE